MFKKIILLAIISNNVLSSDQFFINGRDIRRIFRVIPFFNEIYRDAASDVNENYSENNEEGEEPQQQTNDEQEPEAYYQQKPAEYHNRQKPQFDVIYNSEYSNKNEQFLGQNHNQNDHDCGSGSHPVTRGSTPLKSLRKIQSQGTKLRPEVENPIFKGQPKASKKDYLTGIFVAIPKLNSKDYEKSFYVSGDQLKVLKPSLEGYERANVQDVFRNHERN